MNELTAKVEESRVKVQKIKQRMYVAGGISLTVKIYRASIRKNNPFLKPYANARNEFKAAQKALRAAEMAEWRATLEPLEAGEFEANFTTPPTEAEQDAMVAADVEMEDE